MAESIYYQFGFPPFAMRDSGWPFCKQMTLLGMLFGVVGTFRLEALYGITMLAAIWGVAYWLDRRSDSAIRDLNRQLELIDPSHPDRKVELRDANEDVLLPKDHINELLTQMQIASIHLRQTPRKLPMSCAYHYPSQNRAGSGQS